MKYQKTILTYKFFVEEREEKERGVFIELE